MGTRNLFKIIKDNKTVLAKYSQWDGYLDGQGKALSDFIVNDLNYETLNNGLTRIKMLSKGPELDIIYQNGDISKYPLLTRETDINQVLQAITLGVLPLETYDSSDFQNDGLFCEYAYELNLDQNTITVYSSGQEKCDKKLFTCDVLEYPEVLEKHIKQGE